MKKPKKNDPSKNKPMLPKTPDAIDKTKEDKEGLNPNYPFFPNIPHPTGGEDKIPTPPDAQQGI
ncbi:MAG TPA: hypothetical protein VL947_08780 [Cytophagales bacterium]|nr:hypothetical protein [Cytophagales bacterium]